MQINTSFACFMSTAALLPRTGRMLRGQPNSGLHKVLVATLATLLIGSLQTRTSLCNWKALDANNCGNFMALQLYGSLTAKGIAQVATNEFACAFNCRTWQDKQHKAQIRKCKQHQRNHSLLTPNPWLAKAFSHVERLGPCNFQVLLLLLLSCLLITLSCQRSKDSLASQGQTQMNHIQRLSNSKHAYTLRSSAAQERHGWSRLNDISVRITVKI